MSNNLIGEKVLTQAVGEMAALLEDHAERINTAFLENDGALTVGLQLKFQPSMKAGVDCDVVLNFVAERVKVGNSFSCDENQAPLPFSGD